MWRSDKFFWGAASSAHQVEGGNTNDFSAGGFDAGRACDHYNLFEKDFDIAQSLSHNAHRFSLEWSRIEPEEGSFSEEALRHYEKVIAALKNRGLEPFVTLWHFTSPIWLSKKGGWANPRAVDSFGRYVRVVVARFKDSVKFWIPLNEPEVYAVLCYLRGKWPPRRCNPLAALAVLNNLREAHRTAYGIIKDLQSSAEVGIAENLVGGSALSRWVFNFFNRGTLQRIKNKLDFIGLNYYMKVSLNPLNPLRKNIKTGDLDWEIYPEGIYQNLKYLARFQKPVFVTENGVADAADRLRADFIKDHVRWANKAKDEGVDLRGYFYWSLLDNFEWHHGFGPRFGLVEVNYDTMERKVRPSASEYSRLIK